MSYCTNQKQEYRKLDMEKDMAFKKKSVAVLVSIPAAKPSYFYAAPDGIQIVQGTIVQVPFASQQVVGIVIDDGPDRIFSKALRPISKVFYYPPIQQELIKFIRFVSAYTLTPAGLITRMVLRVPTGCEREQYIDSLHFTGVVPKRMTPARSRVIELASQDKKWTRSSLARAASTSQGVIDGLKMQGVLKTIKFYRPLVIPWPDPAYAPTILENDQRMAADILQTAVLENRFSVSLLDGVTGSGKTEVYFEAVACALRQGRQILILLPEIALTQQFLDRFYTRFGALPAGWHSDLTIRCRERIWSQVLHGHIRVVVGARSALFLPFQNLGLIIVDEEHDAAYKQEGRIFYNARDMAVARGHIAGIPVILASATPSIESQVNVAHGRYRLVSLPARFANAAMPNLTAIDLRKNPPSTGCFLSPLLVSMMKGVLQRREQSLLFLNRRGYAPLTLCRICGYRFSCKNCSSWLVEHRDRGLLLCHHCGYNQPVPEACSRCGALDNLVACGPGVERIAEEVSKEFAGARILVLSTDTVAGVKKIRFEFDSIIRGNVDIVIGTQLVTKGHNFPNMTLVGVIDADIGLANGDPRAAERTFQLLSQVTGRAGRTGVKSHGIIQTYQPDHPVIKALIMNDRASFYTNEIEEREPNYLPPFGKLAALIVSGAVRSEAENYARSLRRSAPHAPEITVLGPAEATLAFVRRRYRFRLLIHGKQCVNIQEFIHVLLAKAPVPRGTVRVQIDIDPQSFL
ncbi:MAG: primosomal protein N' (replication factor Y) (superfamily II helicase) [Candidatus Tokpelaia sp. JSC085]|nr:MAG: primosomal protein N' (replication factor Y) (superfamily II helicase) [Candidatus Tokpelaia sp. JSC085]